MTLLGYRSAIVLSAVAFVGTSAPDTSLAQQNDWFNTIRTDNAKPSEPDYPALNPQPTHTVRMEGTLPSSLKLTFLAYYAADEGAGTVQSGTYCGYKLSYQSFPVFDLTDTINIARTGDHYAGQVIVDKYLPGRCRWQLEFVGYKLLNGANVMSEGYFAQIYDPVRVGNQSPNLYRGKIDIWCRNMVARVDATAGEQCESLSIMKSVSKSNPISPKLLATITTDQYEHQPTTIWMLPETRSIEVIFHDLDTMEGDLAKTSGSTRP
jgi:hypothetical protein